MLKGSMQRLQRLNYEAAQDPFKWQQHLHGSLPPFNYYCTFADVLSDSSYLGAKGLNRSDTHDCSFDCIRIVDRRLLGTEICS